MAKVIDIKCPKCSAPLPISADAQTITCRYCGGTSVVERAGSKAIHAPPGQHVVHVPATAGPVLARALAGAGVTVAITTAVVAANMATTMPQTGPLAAAGSPAQIAQAQAEASSAASYSFNDHPMLADINGDGAPDVLGKVREYNIGEWIAAFDGTSGAELWRTQVLTKDATDGGSLRGVALGRVISIDALGKVQAYDLKNGSPAWSALLGEKASSICEADGVIVVETADEARHGLEPAGGKKREVAAKAPCAPVWSSDRDSNPGYRIIGWWDLEKNKLPGLHDTDGISAHRALVPTGPGPRFLLGGKSKGTSVAMVVAIGDKKKVLWKDVVPGVDPLTTDVNVTTQEAAYTEGVLVVPYDMKDSNGGMRMAAFDANTGARLWDVAALPDQVSSGLAITPERVYIASWTTLFVLSVKTGELQFKIGK